MKLFGNILKISLILIIVLIAAGSAYAADDSPSELDDDFELDEYLDDFDDDLDDDDNLDDGDDLDDDSDDDNLDDDLDGNESDDGYSDFDYLEYRTMAYLERYGDCADENWTQSEGFINEYQIYLADPSNYTLNESSQGYKTYLKIFDSITSTFGDYNLTENETAYLKFMIIYYLNHYGNVSANYTWNESESFENFTLLDFCATELLDTAKGLATSLPKHGLNSDSYGPFHALFYDPAINSENVNLTAKGSHAAVGNSTVGETQDSNNILIFMLILIFALAVLILI